MPVPSSPPCPGTEPRTAWTRELKAALKVAGGYVAFAAAYILVSGHVVRLLATSADELHAFETAKGIAFVATTGVGLFLVTWLVVRKLEAEHRAAREAAALLLRSERAALAGLFVSSIAHDANNVAVVVSSALSAMEDATPDEDTRSAISDAQAAMNHLVRLFADLKAMGRERSSSTRVATDLRAQVERTIAQLHGHSAMKHCRVDVESPAEVSALVFPHLVDQILLNLLLNAADATQRRGRIEVRLSQLADAVRLEVHDDGPGVPPEIAAQLFRPFSTTKPHGTGLGLVSVKECARMHGGSAGYARSPLGGACFSVTFPAAAPAIAAAG